MIDPTYKMPERTLSDFELLPEDTYQVQILEVKLKKDQPKYNSEEVEDLFSFSFVIVEKGEFYKRRLWKDCRQIMNPAFDGGSASWLYKIYSAAMNKSLTKEEAVNIGTTEINELEGKQLRLLVKQKPNTKGVLKNVIEETLAVKKFISVGSDIGGKKKDSEFEEEQAQQVKSLEEEQREKEENEEEINVDDIKF